MIFETTASFILKWFIIPLFSSETNESFFLKAQTHSQWPWKQQATLKTPHPIRLIQWHTMIKLTLSFNGWFWISFRQIIVTNIWQNKFFIFVFWPLKARLLVWLCNTDKVLTQFYIYFRYASLLCCQDLKKTQKYWHRSHVCKEIQYSTTTSRWLV